ncbi:MAG TPA: DUF4173 domain-containing protein [Pyrinomonadaceae bacterium]|nr:DUF4173 domain-containing protein [Pyrinomonadaceae bacterium]
MTKRTRLALEILGSAALIGLLGNVLLRQTPWGLNAFLFVTVFTAAMIAIMARHRTELLTLRTIALQAAMVFFGSMFVVRDSIELRVYDTIAIIVIMGVLMLPNFGVNQRLAGIFHYVTGCVWSGICSAFAPFVLLGADIDWKAMPGNRISKSIFSVFRGLAIALPLVLIFGALFMAADAAFENFANRIVDFDIDTIISHVVLTSLFAWLTAGYFRGTLIEHFVNAAPMAASPVPRNDETTADAAASPASTAKVASPNESFVDKFTAEPAEESSLPNNATVVEHINTSDAPTSGDDVIRNVDGPSREREGPTAEASEPPKRDWQNFDNSKLPPVFTLGTVETVIILGLLNVLFLSFVIFQLQYLFGGFEFVQNTPDLKLADFARRGFGELVAVSFLVLPMLLASHWLLRRDNPRNETIFRIFAGVQITLLFVIMASAMQRLVLLTGELGYGWTTVRFYPMVFMIWLAVVFVWFGWTVLRGDRHNFAWGALWSAIIMLAATNLMNPDDFIARKNIQLMQQGREFDAYYNAKLSDDAVPALIDSLPTMSVEDRCQTRLTLYHRHVEARAENDIRSLNWSREAAFEVLESNSGMLMNRPECGVWK